MVRATKQAFYRLGWLEGGIWERQNGVRHGEEAGGTRAEGGEKQKRQAGSSLGVSMPSENEPITC